VGLQTELNCRPPSHLTPLKTDGIFGPRTLDRVREFQTNSGLAADGIVGPLTLAALNGPGIDVPYRSGLDCGCSDAGAPSLGVLVQQQFASAALRGSPASTLGQARVASPVSFPARVLASIPGAPSPPRPLTPAQQATATAVYATSINFSRVFISDKTGLGNRPFTVTFLRGELMNMGTFTPATNDLIHELAHVWQSQHSSDATLFMRSSVAAQAKAVAANGAAAALHPSVVRHRDFPENFPFSSYAYRPGAVFTSYGAEQIANQVEHGEAPIVAHVRGATTGVDADNMTSLNSGASFDDRRAPGVIY
jgi:hypothetical protein